MFSLFTIVLASSFIFMSDRDAFWDPDKESNKTEEIDEQGVKESEIDFHQFKRKRVLLLVHGFNNSAQDAITTYRQINDQITTLLDASGKPLYDTVIGYLWPGCDSRFDYFSAEKNATQLANRMRLHLNALAYFSNTVDVLAHSMGNRLILGALESLSIQNAMEETGICKKKALNLSQVLTAPNQVYWHKFSDMAWSEIQWLSDVGKNRLLHQGLHKVHPIKPVQNFYSLAAAVDVESIEENHQYYNATQECQNMYVFHSNRDDVLKFLFLIAEKDEALGFKGKGDLNLTSKNIQFIDCTSFVDGHSGYFLAAPLYKFIQNQQANQTIAPDVAPNVKLLADGLIAPIIEK